MARELTQQQIAFCKYYALYGGVKGAGTKSAKEARYKPKGAASMAYHLLKRPEIKERIEEEKKALADKVEMTAQDAIKNIQDCANKQGKFESASEKVALDANVLICKIKGVQGLADKVVIEQKIPYDNWSLEELRELKRTGKVPRGKKIPDIRTISGFISERLSEKSGTGNN